MTTYRHEARATMLNTSRGSWISSSYGTVAEKPHTARPESDTRINNCILRLPNHEHRQQIKRLGIRQALFNAEFARQIKNICIENMELEPRNR